MTEVSSTTHAHSHISSQPLYRITVLFKSRPDQTEKQFYDHWWYNHAPLCIPWALHYNFVEYTHYLTSSENQLALAQGKDSQGGTRSMSPFTAAADFYIKDYQDYLAAFRDPYYLEIVMKDENNFVDKGQAEGSARDDRSDSMDGSARAISMMGYCRSAIKDGKAVIDVPEEVWTKWNDYQSRKKT